MSQNMLLTFKVTSDKTNELGWDTIEDMSDDANYEVFNMLLGI
jgi:hypothetical protein